MKERPILFSAPMVGAIMAGTKTQTRRLVKPQPEAVHGGEPYWFVGGHRAWSYRSTSDVLRKGGNDLPCPYGQAGDRLWVREAWRRYGDGIAYRATYGDESFADEVHAPWKPSIHMPRAASRLTLEVTAVRVEQLQDISDADAVAEGLHRNVDGLWSGGVWKHLRQPNRFRDPCNAFCDLWASINGPGS